MGIPRQWLPVCLLFGAIRFESPLRKDYMLRPKVFIVVPLLLASVPALAQQRYDGSRDHGDHHYRDSQNYRDNQNFYNGVRQGGHGGQYYEPRHAHDGYDERYNQHYDERYNQHKGGIGPGKGAAIGGAGGAVLGAVMGGGLKGALIGGAAGAGIGAIVGETAQNHRDSRDRDSRDRDSHHRY